MLIVPIARLMCHLRVKCRVDEENDDLFSLRRAFLEQQPFVKLLSVLSQSILRIPPIMKFDVFARLNSSNQMQ